MTLTQRKDRVLKLPRGYDNFSPYLMYIRMYVNTRTHMYVRTLELKYFYWSRQ